MNFNDHDDLGDDGFFDCDDDEDFFNCGLQPDGQCSKAGSEECDFECPHRNGEFFAGSAAWQKVNGG